PIITKTGDGTWVVLLTSGYNNVSPGDGNGHLFIVNASTGAKVLDSAHEIVTNDEAGSPVGNTSTPSGLGKINAYTAGVGDNTPEVIYGGDLLGNVWRFDISSKVPPYMAAMRLGQLKVGSVPQPITSKPALADVNYLGTTFKVVYVGTGEYLGASDLANTSKQSIYALKDTRSATGLGDVRNDSKMVVQTASAASSATLGGIVQVTSNAVNWAANDGWYMDLIGSGERVSVNPHLVLNTLYIGTNTPKSDACTVGGTSMLYRLDIGTGSALSGATDKAAGISLGDVLVMGMTTVQLNAQALSSNVTTIVTRSDGTLSTVTGALPTSTGVLRRTSWRVLK
ncbi:MAG: pilus assembly protein, partial [Rhodoferax sp.]